MTRKRKCYLAAPFNWREAAIEARSRLQARGWTVTSEWIDLHTKDWGPEYTCEEWAQEAQRDLVNIDEADCIVLLNGPSTSGGLHVECGYAIGQGKTIYLVGVPTTVFHHLSNFVVVEKIEDIP